MKLGATSRYLLELVTALGADTLESLFRMPHYYKMLDCPSESHFLRKANNLVSKGLLETGGNRASRDWVAKLTNLGTSSLGDEIDPQVEWGTPWDGHWRLLAFDLPKESGTERQALRKWLRSKRLGKLQGSLWITPKDLSNWAEDLVKSKVDPSSVLVIKGDFEGNADPLKYVKSAWNFERINQSYLEYIRFLENRRIDTIRYDQSSHWFRKEISLWRKAYDQDPFLPKELCPREKTGGYLGPKALKLRRRAYKKLKNWLLKQTP